MFAHSLARIIDGPRSTRAISTSSSIFRPYPFPARRGYFLSGDCSSVVANQFHPTVFLWGTTIISFRSSVFFLYKKRLMRLRMLDTRHSLGLWTLEILFQSFVVIHLGDSESRFFFSCGKFKFSKDIWIGCTVSEFISQIIGSFLAHLLHNSRNGLTTVKC